MQIRQITRNNSTRMFDVNQDEIITRNNSLKINFRAAKTMTATDVTGFDAIFSTGVFATFSRF